MDCYQVGIYAFQAHIHTRSIVPVLHALLAVCSSTVILWMILGVASKSLQTHHWRRWWNHLHWADTQRSWCGSVSGGSINFSSASSPIVYYLVVYLAWWDTTAGSYESLRLSTTCWECTETTHFWAEPANGESGWWPKVRSVQGTGEYYGLVQFCGTLFREITSSKFSIANLIPMKL
jgi:hypothetical protein